MTKLNLFYAMSVLLGALVFPNFASAEGFAGRSCNRGDRDPLKCMVCVINAEDNKSKEGMTAVGRVVMQRVRSGRYASSVCGVVHQPGQFFPNKPLPKDPARLAMIVSAAKDAMRLGGNGFLGFRNYCRKGDKRIGAGGNCYRRDALAPETDSSTVGTMDLASVGPRADVIKAADMIFGSIGEAGERVETANLIPATPAATK